MYLPAPKDYEATLTMTYSLRRVLQGGETLTEGDDDIVIGVPASPIVKNFVLVGKDELTATLWYLVAAGSVVKTTSYGSTEQLLFNSLALAQQAVRLLRSCGPEHFRTAFFLDDQARVPLSKEHIESLSINSWDPLKQEEGK